MLPDKTLAVKSDQRRKEGFKAIKDRLTILFTVNKTGSHKLKPLCIGKSRAPRCFHHVNMKSLPFVYSNSKNAWMTSDIFYNWFKKEFVPSLRRHLRLLKLPEKAVLLLDNCPAHPPAETLATRDGKIKVAYLPKNTTSLIQPLDQGIVATFKKNYHRELVSKIIASNVTVTEYLKSLTIKEFFYMGASAWNAVSASTIEGCWMGGLSFAFTDENETDAEENTQDNNNDDDDNDDDDDDDDFLGFSNAEVSIVNNQQVGRFCRALSGDGIAVSADDVDVWLNYDEPAPTTAVLSEEEIIESVTSVQVESGLSDDSNEENDVPAEDINNSTTRLPTAAEAADSLRTALAWLETQNVSSVKLMQLQSLITFAKIAAQASKKQSKITDFVLKQ